MKSITVVFHFACTDLVNWSCVRVLCGSDSDWPANPQLLSTVASLVLSGLYTVVKYQCRSLKCWKCNLRLCDSSRMLLLQQDTRGGVNFGSDLNSSFLVKPPEIQQPPVMFAMFCYLLSYLCLCSVLYLSFQEFYDSLKCSNRVTYLLIWTSFRRRFSTHAPHN